jgi:phosphatidylinositol alpha-mannosyltransferase
MKIGQVCPYNITKGGGVQEIVRAMHKELTKRGHEVRIITPEPRDLTEMHRTKDTIFIGGAADFKSLHTTSQISGTTDMYAIEQILDEEKFDVLHFHEPWVPMLSRQILGRSKSINVATFHAKLPETVMSRTLATVVTPYTKAVLRDLDQLTAVSEAAAEYVRTLTTAPVAIIPNGISLDDFKPPHSFADANKPVKTLLFLGRLERRKGVVHLLNAYARLVERCSDVELIIAGDGPDRRKLEYRVEELELPNVTFLGYVSDKEKHRLLRSSDLFCAPALYGESFGIVLLEAMATGLVTVAGNNPGYASVMQELGTISLVNPKDPVEFARRMDVMLHDEGLRRLWRKWALEYVRQFDYPAIVDEYVSIYRTAHKAETSVAELV